MTQGTRPKLVAGASFGRYRLERLLGTGGMASVWQARDQRLGRDVAVKVLSETLALDDDYVKRFEREAKIAARLSHPNLVGVFDYGTEDGRPYLVSEYVEGGTLADAIAAGDPVDAEALGRQLLEALEHIHGAGVVHRDVKPANVLIDPDGRSRLTDFGIAQPHGATRFTETGKLIGTRGYIAPEVEHGEPATPRSDLYSAGVVIEEAAGGVRSGPLRPLIDALTAERPKSRPKSAKAAAKLLGGETTATEPIAAAAVSKTATMPRTARARHASTDRRKRAAAVIALAGVLALLGFALAQGLGDENTGDSLGPGKVLDRGTRKTATAKPEKPKVAATPVPAQTTPTTPTTAQDPCASLGAAGTGGPPGHGGVPPGQAKKLTGDAKKALDEQVHACEEAQKQALEQQKHALEEQKHAAEHGGD